MSIYESLVAVAIIGIGAAMLSQLNVLAPDKNFSIHRACESYAQQVVGAVQEETYYHRILNFYPTGTNRTVGNNTLFTLTRAVPQVTKYWETPTTANIFLVTNMTTSALQGVPLHNAMLIQGSMRTLMSIYNDPTYAAIRCNYGAYAPLTDVPNTGAKLAMASELQARTPQVKLRLTPYNTDGTALAGCPAPLILGPAGEQPTNAKYSAFAAKSGGQAVLTGYERWSSTTPPPAALPGNIQLGNQTPILTTRGIRMDVLVTYKNDKGVADQQCTFSQKFEYPRDRSPPKKPDVLEVSSNSTWDAVAAAVPACTESKKGTMVLRVGYLTTGDYEPGVEFVCRDLSWIKGFVADPGPNFLHEVCIRDGVIDTSTKVRHDAGGTGVDYDPSATTFTTRDAKWQPCDQLVQCGEKPFSVTYSYANPNVKGNGHIYTVTYKNMPSGCVMNLEAVAVDTAGNSSYKGTPTSSANRAFLDPGPPASNKVPPMDEVHYCPCCSYYSGPTYYGPYTFAVGYYKCGT